MPLSFSLRQSGAVKNIHQNFLKLLSLTIYTAWFCGRLEIMMMNFVFCFFISFSQTNDRPSPTRERARGKENVFGHVTYNQEPNRLLLQLISLLKFFVFVSDFRNNEERPSTTTIFNDKLLGSRFIFSKFWAILKMFDQVKLIKREREREHARSHRRIK